MKSIIFLSLVSFGLAYDKASFYGASYISYPLQEAKGSTDINFNFRTHLSDALLLLAAGKTDYCMVRLEKGKLKLNINLGAGESELFSSKANLNDSQWHHVSIVRREANLTMKVDDSTVRKRLPGRFFELNIHFGVFLGGQGDFTELFLGHMENFRGCMEDVEYNGAKIIEKGRSRAGSVRVEAVTWNCAPEFDADLRSDISFLEEGAYVLLPRINSRAGGRWRLEFKTIAENAMILYNGGGGGRADFLAVEIVDGLIRCKMARGQVHHTTHVSDGKWHQIRLLFNPELIELSVDNIAMSTRIESGGTRYLDLSDSFYLGGIESDKRQRAFSKGIKAADSSLMGCMKPVEVEERVVGLPQAQATCGVSPGCAWWYPCRDSGSAPPCIPGARCRQRGLHHFTCECERRLCINPDYAEDYKVFSKLSSVELVSVSALAVSEGGVASLTARNIEVVLDRHKYGVRPSGVILHVTRPPRHGRLALALDLMTPSHSHSHTHPPIHGPVFTLHDLTGDKVRYVHDGSEHHQDAIVLDMELLQEDQFTLPSYLQGRHAFVLHVNVTPVNDPPVLAIPPTTILRLAQGTRKVITSDILKAEDPDTPPEELLYTIFNGNTQLDSLVSGHIEVSGRIADSFTQRDVNEGLVSYIHDHDARPNMTSSKIELQVSDGMETSAVGVLRVSVVPLQVRLINNTGFQLVHNSFALITDRNLAFTTNAETDAEDGNLQLEYEIVEPAQFGVVERQTTPGPDGEPRWQATECFTGEMLAHEQVRYVHVLGNPAVDHFKFKVSVGQIRTNMLYEFRLTFIKLELYQSSNEELVLNNTREALITSKHLRFETRPLKLENDRIMYTVIRTPRYGVVHLSRRRLQARGIFTQRDLDTGQLRYRLHRRAFSHVRDELSFTVSATDCDRVTGVLTLRHVPAPSPPRLRAALRRLQLAEGSRAVIPATHLHFRADDLTDLVFNLTRLPEHGQIEVVDDSSKIIRDNTSHFTLRELNSDRVYYSHDDSESRHDSFHFMALSLEPEDFQYVGVFHIDIILKNDNSPVRVEEKVFHVVHGGARLITTRDLSYMDADLDTKPSDIVYTVQRSPGDPPNGGTFRADDPSEQMATFTQDDINKNLVLFKHQGKEYGKIALWISDGLFDVNGILEVQASPPFIKTLPTNGSVVENGKVVIITANNIQVDTNMNCLEEDIRYEVTLEPKHGRVQAGESRMFTQLDIVAGRVSYKHADINRDTGPSVEADQFTLKVMCLDTWAESVYPVKIYPSSYWEPLQIIANGPLYVEESTSVHITKDILEVMHPEIDPWNIIYKVKEGPEYGWLEASSTPGLTASENEPMHSKVFEQAVINANRLTYVQSGVNRTRDKVTMDVTNGILWLKDLQLNVIVIPERFYVVSSEITVLEGDKITIKPDLFTTLTDYYQGKVVLYKVIDKPKYGKIMLGDEELTLLPVLKLNSGNIQYVHDGSEEPGDSWQAVALTERGAESEPIYVTVLVRPVNDETPIVAANTGLCVWEGGLFTFTRNELYVTDMDTPAENVTISVVEVQSGYVALLDKNKESVPVAVRRFTQADIDNRRVVFIHQNGTKGKMIFNVTDGIHELSKITFLISTKPVSLKVVCKEKLSVFPLMRVPLSDKTLMSDCSDHTRTIIYKIDRAPTLGRLIMINGDNHHRSIQQFTQKDVNSSLVYYEHTHPLAELTANDSFVFTVEAVSASPLKEQIFHIDISVSSGGLTNFVHVPPIRVNEGNEVPIVVNVTNVVEYLETRAGLRRPQIEAQWSRPAHGELKPPLSTLTRSQLETGLVVYEHDDSDTLFDEIDMCLYLLPDYILLCNVTIPIHVIPVNDQPFRLVTDAPRIRVVRGENYTITKEDLLTEDADTDPAHILYDIIGGPTQGRLLMLPPDDDARVLDGFTQADINAGRVLYEHSASSALQTATFYFRVWDGRFKPTYTVFTVDVVPVLLDASSPRPVYLRQGSNVAALTADQWHLETNAKLATVSYNITRPPAHGTVCVNQEPIIRFSHEQLVDGLVMFMQDDMTAPDDSFELVAYVRDDDATPAFTVPVAVQPLVALSPLHVLTERAKLTLNTMDATGLSDLAATDPVYTIIEKPKFGMIKKIIRTSGEKTTARQREIARFTHEDIKAGVIYYVPNKKLVEVNGFEDNFKFLLAASMFQPAAGEVKIHIGSRQKKKLPGPNDPESHEGIPVSPTAGGYGTALAVALAGAAVAGAALAGAALVAARRWAKDRGGLGKTQSQGAVAPIPLPRPPDHLMPSPPHPHLTPPDKRCLQSERSVQSAQSVQSGGSAACKVTALADGTRYPYGADDHTDAEDWSSYEASESAYPGGVTGANPMLRRNQYWV